MAQIKKPGPRGGRPTRETAELMDLLERKKKLHKSLLQKAEELMEKNSSEARQCLASALQLEEDIKKMEKLLNPEPEEKEKETKITTDEDNGDDFFTQLRDKDNGDEVIYGEEKTESIFKPLWLNEETGEMEAYKGQDTPRLKRRKLIENP